MKKFKLMAIDGNSIVNRAYYGIRMLTAPDGTPTNGIYGFITILQRLLDEEKPDGVCVAFDLRAPTFRHLEYAGYKAQRKGMPEELAVQMPILKQVLDAMGIKRIECEGYEADDLLGSLSRICAADGNECVIVTGDKDSFQLINDSTRVLHVKSRMGQTETINYTPERFFEEYGFQPRGMIDLKSLMGDASDNIPGVAGIGEKTALDLVRRFGSLECILDGLEELDIKDSVRKKLAAGIDSARMSYHLATIVTDAPLELCPRDAAWDRDFTDGLYDIFLRLGFTRFIEKYGLSPSAESAQPSGRSLPEPEELCSAADTAKAMARCAGERLYIYCNSSLEHIGIYCAGQAWAVHAPDEDMLRAIFSSPNEKAGTEIKDILRALGERGIASDNWVFDAALAAYLLDSTAGSYETERLCVSYCGYQPLPERGNEGQAQLSLLDEDEPSDNTRPAALAMALHELEQAMLPRLEKMGVSELYFKTELPLCRVLADMEQEGFLVDRDALAEFGRSMNRSIDQLQAEIWEMAGEEFNINSPKQLGSILFDKLMLPHGKKTRTGWSTNADILEKLRDKHPIVDSILEYRSLTKLKSTYAEGLLKEIAPDGRIHTSFMMTVTDTGRLSSREPNLQNIPIRKSFGAQIRKMFVAGPGCVLVDADYSQIELRILAHISGDENMISAFCSGEDIHRVTASQVFGTDPELVSPEQRSAAKAVNFGIVYGMSAWSLAQDIKVSPARAKEYMDAYLDKYAGVRDYQKSIVRQARDDGYVSTCFSRRRPLPELKSSNFALRSFGERVALNMPVQGTAADIIKMAMVSVHRRLAQEGLAAKLILQVHDELIVEAPEAEAERVKAILQEEMESAADFAVPLTAQAAIGKTWAEAH